MNVAQKLFNFLLAVGSIGLLSSCEKGGGSFTLSADTAQFQQAATFVPRKLDVLFVVDNSGSMAASQASLATNFPNFINYFKTKGYDFRIAVTTTDAYYGDQFVNLPCSLCNINQTKFRATPLSGQSAVYVIDNNTPSLEQVFSSNVQVGINGSGDERAFSSFKAALNSSLNTGFHRSDAYLSVIIVSDSDDFSHGLQDVVADYALNESYSQAGLHTIDSYVSFLQTFTSGQPTTDFSVTTIGVLDATCRDTLAVENKISTRYMALSDATGGTKNSICSSFDTVLNNISSTIASQTTAQFHLDRTPIASTIRVIINGSLIPEDAANGWQYDSATNIVTVKGSYAPQSGDNVKINFDPASLTN